MDAFVHASGDGFGNTAPLRSDTGAIDMDAISQVAHVTQGAGKLTRKEKKHAKREMKRRKKEAKKAEKEAKKTYSSIKSQLKDRDKELSDKMADARKKRDSAKDVVNYIGYNKMYQDGICEVEEGMFSSSIAFDDTSYHSVRDEQQKAMFSAITRLYDQFGADTLVQMSVINTPLLKEEVGHRKFFDPERQANDAARNDAQVFNNILNDKVKEGVSNIRRNRYLTYSVTADTAEDAARQLSRIEVESSRILNSIGSKAHLMNGTQRLSVIHSLLNPYKPFLFDYQRDISAKRLQTTKDCIAPTQIDFRPDGHYNDCVKLDNGVYAQVLVMKKFGKTAASAGGWKYRDFRYRFRRGGFPLRERGGSVHLPAKSCHFRHRGDGKSRISLPARLLEGRGDGGFLHRSKRRYRSRGVRPGDRGEPVAHGWRDCPRGRVLHRYQ